MPNNYCLDIAGDFACFTRPEMKVERVSYDVITPSAARAVFEAIFWKPAICWKITRIEVLNSIQWISVRRNEVDSIATKSGRMPCIYVEEKRQQRAGLFLRDVRYRIFADLVFMQDRDPESNYGKYADMFKRRAEKGQCFNQPYLGCREFSCQFRYIADLTNEPLALEESRQLGWMLYDMDYSNKEAPNPRFFNVDMVNGVIKIPEWNSSEVKR